jgi:hypothetical protein
MVELSMTAITGIKDAEHEGFIAGTLYAQGWNITLRALDCDDIVNALTEIREQKPILLLATDLDGLTVSKIAHFRSQGFTVFLFSSQPHQSEHSGCIDFPATALDLIAMIRGSVRAPLIRSAHTSMAKTARTIAFASASHGSGCTLVASNIAVELSLLGHSVLLVDADSEFPAIADRLSQRGLKDGFLSIAENLWGCEITQATLAADIAALYEAQTKYQFIIMDLGTIRNFAASLTSRRWESETLIWSCQSADNLIFITKDDRTSLERLRQVLRECTPHSIKPKLSFIQTLRTPGKKRSDSDESLLQSIKPFAAESLMQIVNDSRSAERAERDCTSLYEANDKSALPRAIADIAGLIAK